MRWTRYLAAAALLTLALPGVSARAAEAGQPPPTASGGRPDNSGQNKRDTAGNLPTADTQSNSTSDVQIAAEIRKSVVADRTLSTYAHNVKIIVKDGRVTLRGPVHSDTERAIVADKAIRIVGADHVDNQLEIMPPK
jgi:hyperosmotically inducible protein